LLFDDRENDRRIYSAIVGALKSAQKGRQASPAPTAAKGHMKCTRKETDGFHLPLQWDFSATVGGFSPEDCFMGA